MYSREVDKITGIKCDQIGMLETYKSLKAYPDKLRRVKYYDEELGREFVFITNNMERTLSRGNSLAIQEPLAGGTIFQMDKATPESKIFWGDHDECSQDTNVLCHHNILSGYHCRLQIEN